MIQRKEGKDMKRFRLVVPRGVNVENGRLGNCDD